MGEFATSKVFLPLTVAKTTVDPAKSRKRLKQTALTTVVAALMLCNALAGCSKPTDAVVPTDPKQWDGEFAQKIKNLSEADKGLLAAYLMRTQLGEVLGKQGMPVGTTVGQAIDARVPICRGIANGPRYISRFLMHAARDFAHRCVWAAQLLHRARSTVQLT